MNSKPKYVASSTLTDPQWADTTVISGDLSAAVGELREQPGGGLLVPGGGTLIRWLLANDLVDEINLFLAPVIIGQGTRLFPETGPDTGSRADGIERHVQRGDRSGLPPERSSALRADDRHDAGLERVSAQTCIPT